MTAQVVPARSYFGCIIRVFDIPALIECISAGIELKPGDVISTGTPVGVGIGFTPPRFLQPGDNIRIEIDGIGLLENTVGKF